LQVIHSLGFSLQALSQTMPTSE